MSATRSAGEPRVRPAPELSRRWLLAVGWLLAALLPVAALGLVAGEYAQFTRQRDARLQLVAEAVERQLADRLYLLGLQMRTVARRASRQSSWIIPMHGLRTEPAPAGAAPGPSRMAIGPPVRHGGEWRLPVALRDGTRIVHAHVDTSLFTGVVRNYTLGDNGFVSLVHADGTLVTRSIDHDRHVGRRIVDSGLFADANRGRAAGVYTGRSVVDGIRRVYAFRRVEGRPLAILVGVEHRSAWTTWARPAALILLIGLLLAAAWGWLVSRFDRAQRRQGVLITQLEAALAAGRDSDERLRHAHALARLGEYEWDVAGEHVLLSELGARIYGFDEAGPVTLDEILQRIHPEDRPRIESGIESGIATGDTTEGQYRVVHPDGTVRHVFARGRVEVAADGRRLARGVLQDITELAETRERALRAEDEYRFLFEHNPLPMWVFDRDTLDIVAVNDAMVAHYGYPRDALVGCSMLSIRPPEEWDAMREAAKLSTRERRQGRIWTHLHQDGRAMRMQVFSHDIDFDGRRARLVAAQDVTEREQADQRFQLVARATSDAVYDYNVVTGELWWSDSYYTRFGHRQGENDDFVDWSLFVHPEDRERVGTSLQAALAGEDGEWQEQYRYRRGDGSYASVLDRGFVLRDATGRAIRLVGGMLDISERQSYEDQLAWRATHDELTGLPNRQLLQDRLQQALANAQRYRREGALVFIDLDDFKLVNDSLGHSAGDRVLREVGQRLAGVARETDTVARFGGDEFVVVLNEVGSDAAIHEVLARLNAELARPLSVGGAQHTLTASIGWCRFPEAGADVETLLMHGDLAMYQAKRQGRNRAVPFQSDFVDGISRRLQLVGQLRQAIERDEFVPVFQPLFDRDERPVALETLLRWRHPERGLLLPAEFIAVCEESGLIVDVGRRVLQQAARHYRMLAEVGLGHLRIAVNVSPAQFNDELVRHVREVVETYAMPAEILELEITEGLLMTDPERAIELMRQITALGVTFSVDDFGTGYSSLAYLKRFPIDRLKIDRSFVRDLGVDEDDAAICNSIIGLAHALDIRTVAEGVETVLQLDWLRMRRIDEVQGYLLGRPLPFDELLPLLMGHGRPVETA